MNSRKSIAGIVALAMTICSVAVMPTASILSHADSVTLGDANGSGGVTGTDAAYINSYLIGAVHPTDGQFTAMDINKDGIVDKTDSQVILSKLAHGDSFLETTSSFYSLPSDTSAEYYKHTYGSNPNTSYYSIATNGTITVLNNNVSLSSSDNDFDFESAEEEENDNIRYDSGFDPDNDNCEPAKVFTNKAMTSGFVVDSNVIATAAHNIVHNGQFDNYVYVRVHQTNYSHTGVIAEGYAASVHIPYHYIYPDANHPQADYDYALIYIEEDEQGEDVDLSDYTADLGIISDEFMDSNNTQFNKDAELSGYALFNDGNDFRRYKTSGSICSPFGNQCFYANYPFSARMTGGMVYKETTGVYNALTKSAIGIQQRTDSGYSVGMKFNPTLLRFYFQNSSNLS